MTGIRARVDECFIVEEDMDLTVERLERSMEVTKGSDLERWRSSPRPLYLHSRCCNVPPRLANATRCLLDPPMRGSYERELIYDRHGLYPLLYLDKYGIVGANYPCTLDPP